MFDEDLTAFLRVEDLAVAAIYTPYGGEAVTVNVNFDNPGIDALGMTARNPTAVGISTDFDDFTTRDTLQIGDVVYKILDVQAIDDAAFSTLNLGRTS